MGYPRRCSRVCSSSQPISMSRFVPQMWYLFLEKAGPICSKNFGMSLAWASARIWWTAVSGEPSHYWNTPISLWAKSAAFFAFPVNHIFKMRLRNTSIWRLSHIGRNMISHRKWSVRHGLANDVTTVVLKNIQRALETMGEDGLNLFQLRPETDCPGWGESNA